MTQNDYVNYSIKKQRIQKQVNYLINKMNMPQ